MKLGKEDKKDRGKLPTSLRKVVRLESIFQSREFGSHTDRQTDRRVALSFMFSLACVRTPEWQENFVASLLVCHTKINSCVYPLERWKSFHVSRRAENDST